MKLALALKTFFALTPLSFLLGASALDPATIQVGNDSVRSVGWTDGVCYTPIVEALPGDKLKFIFGEHNVYKLASEEHFDSCNFDDAVLVADFGQSPFDYEITDEDAKAGKIFFSCSIGAHCAGQQKLVVNVAEAGVLRLEAPKSSFVTGLNSQQCSDVHKSGGDIPSDINGSPSVCSDPVLQEDGNFFVSCLSPPATLTPGGVVNNLFTVHFPYPSDRRVAVVQRSWEYVEGDPGLNGEGVSPVNVNQLYVHHVTGNIVLAQGAEGMRRAEPEAPYPEPYAVVTGDESENMVFHLIDLRQVEDWLPCIECRCRGADGTYLGTGGGGDGMTGGISCCSNCTDLVGPTVDYRLRYNVTYQDIEPETPVTNVLQLGADVAPALGAQVEFDVPHFSDLPLEHQKPGDPKVQRLERVVKFEQLFTLRRRGYKHDYVKILRCVSHLHVGGIGLWLYDAVTEEPLCQGISTYGTDPEMNQGFITSIRVNSHDTPKVIPADRPVRLVSDYDATEIHTGVMGLLVLFVSSEEQVTASDTDLEMDVCSYPTCNPMFLPGGAGSTITETSSSTNNEGGCVDRISSFAFCETRGICTCQELMDSSQFDAACGQAIPTQIGNIMVDAICANYCDKCLPEGQCLDIFDNCEEVVGLSTGCGGVAGAASGNAVEINSICPSYCNACDEQQQEADLEDDQQQQQSGGMIEEVLMHQYERYLQDTCKYSTIECQHVLNNLYSCGEGKPGSELVASPNEFSFLVEHGRSLALKYSYLGTPELHAGKTFEKHALPCVVTNPMSDENDNDGIDAALEDDIMSGVAQFSGMMAMGGGVVSLFLTVFLF